ncbi:MAG: triose-phosphate isomerase [Woeseiaceae bacterium]|nr:triose-phosphate isomerase [Woeseiaceae bacterium]
MRNLLIAGNWKMNGDTATSASLVDGIVSGYTGSNGVELIVCPPFPFLRSMAARVAGTAVGIGAQNVSEHAAGAYTGEVSAQMLHDVGCRYVIVGHSERRTLFGETSAQVAEKFAAAQAAALMPILCVGETLAERESNQTEAVVDEQLDAVLERAGVAAFANAVIAYEPVWAIGTGEVATPEQAQDVHAHIRGRLSARDESVAADIRLLYGGSMKGDNAPGLLAMDDIDGGLIGGASLKAEDFLAIADAAVASIGG